MTMVMDICGHVNWDDKDGQSKGEISYISRECGHVNLDNNIQVKWENSSNLGELLSC